jgi:hypothetical protein
LTVEFKCVIKGDSRGIAKTLWMHLHVSRTNNSQNHK